MFRVPEQAIVVAVQDVGGQVFFGKEGGVAAGCGHKCVARDGKLRAMAKSWNIRR